GRCTAHLGEGGEGLHARRRRPGSPRRRRGGRGRRAGSAHGDRHLLREVGDLPRRGGQGRRHRALHRRPPPRVRGEPGGLGAPRHLAGRPGHGADGHPADLPPHPRGVGARAARHRGDRRLHHGGHLLDHTAGPAVHRRWPCPRRGVGRLPGMVAEGRRRRLSRHPRRVRGPGGRRSSALRAVVRRRVEQGLDRGLSDREPPGPPATRATRRARAV
ncbi:MAG: putative secreted protein, partial [uncultured Acidimicrobiales bacterium]